MKRLLIAALLGMLAACAGTGTGQPPLLTAERDALLVDQSFIKIANLLASTQGEPANVVAVAHALTNGSTQPLDVVQTGLQALIAGTTPPPTVATFADALNLLDVALADLAPIAANAGPQTNTILIAAEIMLTTAETIASSQAPTTAARRVAHAGPAGMTKDDARRTLRTFVAAHR